MIFDKKNTMILHKLSSREDEDINKRNNWTPNSILTENMAAMGVLKISLSSWDRAAVDVLFYQSKFHHRMTVEEPEIKHCQRHNGPKGWVQLTKVTYSSHITSSNTKFDQISSSEYWPSTSFEISTSANMSISTKLKIQDIDQTWLIP